MKTTIKVKWEVEHPNRPRHIGRPWDIQHTCQNRKEVARRMIIPANSLKYHKWSNCSHAQLENPEIDLNLGPTEFKCISRVRRFDQESYYRKCKELAEELFKYGARINGMPGINWNSIKLDRELFYSIEEEEVIVKIIKVEITEK